MGVTAEQGPLITFGQAQSLDANPAAGPNAWYQGDMLLDPRGPFTYQPGERDDQPNYGWLSTTALALIDQIPSAVATNNIVNAATPTAGTALTLVSSTGAGITVGCSIINASTNTTVTGLLGIDVNTATSTQPPVDFGQGGTGNGGPINAWNPLWTSARCLLLTNNGNDSSGTYVVRGFDIYGYPLTQTLTGPSTGTVATTKAFKYVLSITPAGTINSTSVSVGTTDTYGIPLRTDRFPYLQVWWGTPQGLITGGSTGGQTTMEIPINVTTGGGLANGQQYALDVPFDGTLVAINYRVTTATTGSGATVTLTAQANGASVTGGVVTPTLANSGTIGNKVAGSAITAGNTFTAGQTVGFVVSAFTGATTGAGIVELVVQNNDASGGTFIAAVTTSPATTITGDVRGTFATPSASDGTKRLTVFWSPIPSNMTTTAGLVGVPQV